VIARARRRGLATSAARLLSQWAFASLGFAAIYIDREPANLASAHVAEQLGATHTGVRTVRVRGSVYRLERHTLAR
jgi:RimJ/RimL family protein N-acetyltransferase